MRTEEERAYGRQRVHLALDAYERATHHLEIKERYRELDPPGEWAPYFVALGRASKAAVELAEAAQHEAGLLAEEAASCVPDMPDGC